MYNKVIDKTHIINGYICFCDSSHPLAHRSNGRVYMHRHIASITAGRWITNDEVVHHIDNNRANNDPSNLMILSHAEHTNIHKNIIQEKECEYCNLKFKPSNVEQKFCSIDCQSSNRIKNKEITKEILDELIPITSWVDLGKLFGYSDNGIKKRAKSLGCDISKAKIKYKI